MADAAVAAPTKLTPEEQKAVNDAQAQSRALMARATQHTDVHKSIDVVATEAAKAGVDCVPCMIAKAFTLTLSDAEAKALKFPFDTKDSPQIRFLQGVHSVPRPLLAHWYVKAHKVEPYAGPTAPPAKAETILGSSLYTKDIDIGGRVYPVGEINMAAFTASGLDAAAWNSLDDEKRGELMLDIVESRNKVAAKPVAKK